MKDDALAQVVGRVSKRDHLRTRLDASPVEKRVAKRARGGLKRTFGQSLAPALCDELHAKALAKPGHLARDRVRAFAQCVVVMRRDQVVPRFVERDEKRCGVGAAGHGRKDSSFRQRRNQHALASTWALSQSTSDLSSGSSTTPISSRARMPASKRRLASSTSPFLMAIAAQFRWLPALP